MGSRIFLTNLTSDVSGYKLALVDMRNPNVPSTPLTLLTNSAGSGSNIAQTATYGGTAVKWITRKLSKAVTLGGQTNEANFYHLWGRELAASANSTFTIKLCQYTTSQQTPFVVDTWGTELSASSTTNVPNQWVGQPASAWTSTAFAVGDRLVVLPYIDAIGTMGAGSVVMSYDGAAFSDGDSYVEVNEILEVSQAQIGSASTPGIPNKSVSYFFNVANELGIADVGSTSGSWLSDDTTVRAAINEANNQKGLV